MKHIQKMMLVPEHLLQGLETEHRLTSPPQLTTLTRLDQDMKHITDSTLPEDQKMALLDQLLKRYQGLSKQMKSETKTKRAGTATTTPNAPTPNHSPAISEVHPKETAHRKLPATPVGPIGLNKGCNNGVHVCLKSVKELRMLLFSTQNNFFSSIFFLLHASIASMQV